MPKYTGKYVQFSFPISAYHPDALQSGYTEKELRKEYSRLRDVAQKRLKRLEASEFSETQTVRYNKDRFIPTRKIKSTGDLTHLLGDLARFLTASLSTVTGMKEYRKKSVESLQEGGLKAINESNFTQMTQILDWAAAFKEYDPSELVQMINKALESGLSKDDILVNLEYLYDEWHSTGSIEVWLGENWDE